MSPMLVRVEKDPAAAGHAVIRVLGAAGAQTNPGFGLRRGEDWDEAVLGPNGWQARGELLMPARASVEGSELVLHVAPSVCSHLEAGPYTFDLPGAGLMGQVVNWPDIPTVHAGAMGVLNLRDGPRAAEPEMIGMDARPANVPMPDDAEQRFRPVREAPPPIPPAIVPASVAPSRPPGPTTPVVSSGSLGQERGAGILAALLVLVLLLGSAYAFWWNNYRQADPVAPPALPAAQPPAPMPVVQPPVVQPTVGQPPVGQPPIVAPTPPPPSVPPSTPSRPPAPPSLSGMSVPDVLAHAPNPAAITAEGLRRLRGGQPDQGMMLLEAADDPPRNDGGAAAALARLYDPLKFQPGGPIPAPDARQAARHYRDAAARGVDVTADREALRRSLEAKARAGDLAANLALRDFWP